MAIGTMAAIGLAAAGVGAAVSSGSQKSAAKNAAATQQNVANQNNALAANIYGQNQAALSPFMQRGNAAGNQINALLGLGGAPQGGQMPAGYGYGTLDGQAGLGTPAAGQSAGNAFNTFRNSTGYQFRLGEGMGAMNSGLASSGVLQSGAAMKEAQRYGQNFASNEFGNYMGYLGNQQGVGLGGASALAGVAQNYGNNVQANNQNAADARGNSFLIAGQNNPFANALGMIGGGMFKLGA